MGQCHDYFIVSIPKARFTNFIVEAPDKNKAIKKALSYINSNPDKFSGYLGKKKKIFTLKDIGGLIFTSKIRTEGRLDIDKEYDLEVNGLLVAGGKKIKDIENHILLLESE